MSLWCNIAITRLYLPSSSKPNRREIVKPIQSLPTTSGAVWSFISKSIAERL